MSLLYTKLDSNNYPQDDLRKRHSTNTETLHRQHNVNESGVNKSIHPAWRAFIDYCTDLQYGEIELLKIQDGLPVLAEVVRKKIKF